MQAVGDRLDKGVYVSMNGRCFDWDNVKKNRASGIFEEVAQGID